MSAFGPPRVSAAMRAALKNKSRRAVFFECDHPDGVVRAWTGAHVIAWNGAEWQGVGPLGRVSGLDDDTSMAIRTLSIELRAVPVDVAKWIKTNIRNRAATLWLACLNRRLKVIPAPLVLCRAALDYQEMPVSDEGQVTIVLRARIGFLSVERALDIAWTHEEQQKLYPGDTGLSLIPTFQNKEVNRKPPA